MTTVKAADLAHAAAICRAALDKNTTLPVLKIVLVERLPGALRLTATDLDNRVEMTIPEETELTAKTIDDDPPIKFFDGQMLAAVAAAVPPDETIQIIGREIIAGIVRYDFAPLDVASEFPESAFGKPAIRLEDIRPFVNVLPLVRFAISTEPTRYYLNGVCLERGRVTAINGHVLASVACPGLDIDALEGKRLIIPTGALKLLDRMPVQDGWTMTLDNTGLRVRFSSPDGRHHLSARLIDGTYPDYELVIPKPEDAVTRISVDGPDMLAALRRLGAIRATGKHAAWLPVECRLTADDLHLTAKNSLLDATAVVTVPILSREGPDITLGLAHNYLSSIFRQCRGVVRIGCKDVTDHPVRFDIDGAVFVQMPCRI